MSLTADETFWAAAGVVLAAATFLGSLFASVYKFRGELDKKMSFAAHAKICQERDGSIQTKLGALEQLLERQNERSDERDKETHAHREKTTQDLGGLQLNLAVVTQRVDTIAANQDKDSGPRPRRRSVR